MKESITIPVLAGDDEDAELRLEVDAEDNVFSIFCNNKEICSGDWKGNLVDMIKRALEIWNLNDPD